MAEVAVGQVWRDEDGLLWRVVAVQPNGVYVKRADLHGAAARGQSAVQTNPGWFAVWAKVEEAGVGG